MGRGVASTFTFTTIVEGELFWTVTAQVPGTSVASSMAALQLTSVETGTHVKGIPAGRVGPR